MALDQLVVELTAQNKELLATLKSSVTATQGSTDAMNKALAELKDQGEKSTSGLSSAWSVMTGVLSAEAVMAAIGAVKDAFISLVVEGTQGAMEYQDALRGMNNALALSGKYSAEASSELDAFANKIEETSNFSDTAALSVIKLFSSVNRLDKEGLKGATQASADLAAALGMDLEQAASLVSKAINGNEGALKKYGIALKDIEEGADNTQKVLAQLSSRFGGAAAGQITTFAGQVNQLKNGFEDFTKEIGNTVISNKAVQNAIGAVGKIFKDLESIIVSNSSKIKEFIDNLVIGTASVLKAVVQMSDGIRTAFNAIGSYIGASIGFWIESFDALSMAMTGDISGAFDKLVESGKNVFSTVKESVEQTNPALEFMKTAIDNVGNAAAEGMGVVQTASDQAGTSIDDQRQKINALAIEEEKRVAAAKFAAAELVTLSDNQRNMNALELEELNIHHDAKLISEEAYWAARQTLLADNIANETASLDAQRAAGTLTETQYQAKMLELKKKASIDAIRLSEEEKKAKDAFNRQQLQGAAGMFGDLATLTSTGSRSLFEIGKASAIAQATIQTYLAASKALAEGGPFLGPAMAAAAVTAGLVNVAKISSQTFKAANGIDQVPGSGVGDKVPFMLEPKERVISKGQNKDLTEFLESGSKGGHTFNLTFNDVFSSDMRTLGMKVTEAINEAAQAMDVRLIGVRTV